MELLTLAHFAGCLNETFTAALNGMDVSFVLVEAVPTPMRGRPDGWREPFSLLFRNDAAILFPQQTYPMRHPRLGEFGIFMVPIAQQREGYLYQAVFN